MYATTLSGFGDVNVMQWAYQTDPTAGHGEVVIDIAAAGVNRADLAQRQGNYPPPRGASDILGLECSGTISEVGGGVTDWAVGDEVCALLSGGGYAERVAVPASQVLPVPEGVDIYTAAALPEAACTVWSNLGIIAQLRADETVLLHGGGSGIGTHAIQLAKAIGARVAVTAGSASKLEACEALGADILINYSDTDFVDRLKEATDGVGAHVILDIIGGPYLPRNIAALAPDGRLIVVGLQGGSSSEIDLLTLMAKRASLHVTGLRSRPDSGANSKQAVVQQVREHAWPLIARGAIRPVVDTILPVDQAAKAHQILAANAATGKVLLRIN